MASAESGCKDSYDGVLEFSRITHENWLLPDRREYLLSAPSGAEWPVPLLEPVLEATVPRDVRRAFETVRGCMIYGWFFYPLATLGLEQCTRVAEAAARERCSLLQHLSEDFADSLRTLRAAGVISAADDVRWQAVRRLRNDRSHLKGHMLVDHGQAQNLLRTTTELVNALFH